MSGSRLLLVHRYFWPDTPPYATILREIARRLREDGHQVEVLSAQPSYKPTAGIDRRPWREPLDGFVVRRVRALDNSRSFIKAAAGHASFVMLAFWALIAGRKRDIVMCSTVPPVVLSSALSIGAKIRGARFIYHCMDLHPDVSVKRERLSTLQKLMRRVDTATCRRADAIVVLSGDMKRTLTQRDSALESKIVVINNFDLRDIDEMPPAAPPERGSRLRVVFTGNLGRFQGLVELADALNASGLPVELVLMGDGAVARGLRERQSDVPEGPAVRVLAHGSASEARALMRTADLGLVSLVPGVIRSAYPSKTITYLAEGLPLLAVVDDDSELARTVTEHGIGHQVAPGDIEGVVSVLKTLCNDRDRIVRLRERVAEYAANQLDRDEVLERWAELISDTAGRSGENA